MMVDELNINKDTIPQIFHKDLWKRRICAEFLLHRLTDDQKQRRLTSCQDLIQTCQDNSSFLYCSFLFPKVKTALRRKMFQDVEGIKENVTPKLNTVPLEVFAVFKNFINIFLFPRIFYFLLSHQSWNFIARPCIIVEFG
jgi:hypothetical protein